MCIFATNILTFSFLVSIKGWRKYLIIIWSKIQILKLFYFLSPQFVDFLFEVSSITASQFFFIYFFVLFTCSSSYTSNIFMNKQCHSGSVPIVCSLIHLPFSNLQCFVLDVTCIQFSVRFYLFFHYDILRYLSVFFLTDVFRQTTPIFSQACCFLCNMF